MARRLEVNHFDAAIGFWDAKAKKRLPYLYPNRTIMRKVKASAYQGGVIEIPMSDLHSKMLGRKTVSMKEYKKLSKQFKQSKDYKRW